MNTSALIIYLSSHGTTQTAMTAFAESLTENGVTFDIHNLNTFKEKKDIEKLYAMIPEYPLIVLGSPTYFHHAPPVFMEFIKSIPATSTDQAVCLLSTFGGVSSGVIQYDLAKILEKKKYRLIGGMKVLTEHCLTFQKNTPFYAGHPNETDLAEIKTFGKEIAGRLTGNDRVHYKAAAFKDKPFLVNFIDDHINKLNNFTWAMPNVKVNKKTCTSCGICAQNCPTQNISINTIAEHGKRCTYCYGCVRACPNGAAKANLKPMPPMVKLLAKTFAKYEDQVTQQTV